MRVGVAWNHPSALGECSFRFESYLEGLAALGHEGIVVCTQESDRGLEVPRVSVASSEDLATPDAWRALDLDAVVIVTWHRMSHVLQAIRSAGIRVIAISDTDGLVGYRDHPLGTWRRLVISAPTPRLKLRAARFWFRQWRHSLRGKCELEQEVLDSTCASDVVVQGNQRSREHLIAFLEQRGEARLAARVRVAPFAIATVFLEGEVAGSRHDRIAVIGRWTDPQKDARLVARVLERYLQLRPKAEVRIAGESERHLATLADRHPKRVHYLGLVTFPQLAQELRSCRILFSASHWEGSPHAAFESLASGLSLVGPRIPCFESWTELEDFGTSAARRSARSLLSALLEESERWDRGGRSHAAIAREWRRRLDPGEICRAMLD